MKTASQMNISKGIRILQIIVGIIAIALSIAVIVNPGFGIEFLVFLLSITLLVAGIERVAIGFLPYITKSSTRITNIVLGGLAIALSIIVIAFPIFTIGLLVTLLALGLLFIGIARIVQGIFAKQTSKWSRAFLIGVGILSIGISVMVFINPVVGIFIMTFMLAVNLLIIGIESIVHGVSGRRNLAASASTSTTTTNSHGQ
ncbi:MAG: HdeD family acid-resistance protein [Deltaproteobacteria bacterium]